MVKKLFILVILLLVSTPIIVSSSNYAFAESVDTAWVRRYNGPADSTDEASAIAVDKSGNVYVTGQSVGSETSEDYATIKYYPNGDTAWLRRYNGPGSGMDLAYGITIDNSGNVYVTGRSYVGSGIDYDYATIKYYPTGDTAWVRRYNGPGNSIDYALAIAVDDSGNAYVTGRSYGSGTSQDYATIKYYPNGDTAWVRRYNGPGNSDDHALRIAIDDSGNVYVTGYSFGSGTDYDYATIKYHVNGDTAWVRRYNGPGDSSDMATAIVVDSLSNVYVTGYSWNGTDYDYATIKYYYTGDTAWVRRYNGPANGDDRAYDIALDGFDNVYVTGYSDSTGTYQDYATIKYDSSGNQLWVKRYNGPPGNGSDEATAIAIDGSNNVYVSGWSGGGATIFDYATIKYPPDGDTAWVRRYNGPGNGDDRASAIAIDDSGNVYVTGKSYGSGTSEDYCTIKYVQNISYVSITDTAFVPEVDTITKGSSIRWTNNGTEPHSTTSDAKSNWDSDTLYPGESFTFQFNSPGSYSYHCKFHLSMTGTIVVQPPSDVRDQTGDKEKPTEYVLSQNYPNPFNQSTKIEFTLAKSCFVSLNIYDILGRKVTTLVSEHLSSGYKSVLWDGKNDSGKEVASGIYFYQIKAGNFAQTKKLVLLK